MALLVEFGDLILKYVKVSVWVCALFSPSAEDKSGAGEDDVP